jgi:predicted adenine nucleotide alpha hydrolase (AANH) superfamily ATPase
MAGRNYQLDMEAILLGLDNDSIKIDGSGRQGDHKSSEKGGMSKPPSLLLHSCCAPWSSYVYSYLREHFAIVGYYYNPNIGPVEEYEKRFEELEHLVSHLEGTAKSGYDIELNKGAYEKDLFIETSRGLEHEPEGGARCRRCFELRLRRTAQEAVRLGTDYFGTTLTVSPHKNADVINEIGERLSAEYGVGWLLSDFKKRCGYQKSVALSKEYGLYRQNYCGCAFSKYVNCASTQKV